MLSSFSSSSLQRLQLAAANAVSTGSGRSRRRRRRRTSLCRTPRRHGHQCVASGRGPKHGSSTVPRGISERSSSAQPQPKFSGTSENQRTLTASGFKMNHNSGSSLQPYLHKPTATVLEVNGPHRLNLIPDSPGATALAVLTLEVCASSLHRTRST